MGFRRTGRLSESANCPAVVWGTVGEGRVRERARVYAALTTSDRKGTAFRMHGTYPVFSVQLHEARFGGASAEMRPRWRGRGINVYSERNRRWWSRSLALGTSSVPDALGTSSQLRPGDQLKLILELGAV